MKDLKSPDVFQNMARAVEVGDLQRCLDFYDTVTREDVAELAKTILERRVLDLSDMAMQLQTVFTLKKCSPELRDLLISVTVQVETLEKNIKYILKEAE